MTYRGVFTALVTPFRGGQVDLPAFRAHCERQLAAGVDGLVPCGTTGETPTLSPSEWRSLVETAVQVAGGRVPVVAGCGTNETAGSVARIQEARAMGADGALVVFPYYNKPPPAGLRAHLQACAAAGLPLVLYHVPGRTGQRLPPSLLAELAGLEGVGAVKEATGDMEYANDLLPLTRVPVLSGDDATILPFVVLGGAGVISVLSNVAPRGTRQILEAVAQGDLDRARTLHYRYLPLVRWLFHTTSPIPCKALMARVGWCTDQLRLPLVSLQAEVPSHLVDLVEDP